MLLNNFKCQVFLSHRWAGPICWTWTSSAWTRRLPAACGTRCPRCPARSGPCPSPTPESAEWDETHVFKDRSRDSFSCITLNVSDCWGLEKFGSFGVGRWGLALGTYPGCGPAPDPEGCGCPPCLKWFQAHQASLYEVLSIIELVKAEKLHYFSHISIPNPSE